MFRAFMEVATACRSRGVFPRARFSRAWAAFAAVAAFAVLPAVRAEAGAVPRGGAAARVRWSSMVLKTYPFSDPDPVPATERNTYPYARFDGSSHEGSPREWKTVELENDRIRVTVTPEIGGKIWGAVDKATGVDFIYFNHVAKFRDVAQCGPWTSGGIEFNFGIVGHSPTCSAPVDCAIRTNGDGSASCFVGATEWVCGTTWQVEIRLGAGDDFFETRTAWHNGSGFPEPYYQWMNAAFHLEEKARFDFPGTAQIGHDGKASPWPVDACGRDLSVYANNAFGAEKSRHVINGDSGYYGVWWPARGLGAYHANDAGEKCGRKIWLWALSRAGGIWEDLLTDSDGQYAELQSGRTFHQPQSTTHLTPFKHVTFDPGRTDRFTERWGVLRAEPRARDPKTFAAPRPLEMPVDFDWSGAYGLYLKGVQALRNASPAAGEAALKAALAKEPHFAPALDELALLAAKRGRWPEARAYARRALAIDTYDAAANYADALAACANGDWETARERLGLAAYSPVYRTVARTRLAQAELRRGDAAAALRAAERAFAQDPDSPDAALAKMVALRKAGRIAAARALARDVLVRWPFHRGAQHETGCVTPCADAREWLALGAWYAAAGLAEDAVAAWGRAGDGTLARILAAHAANRPEDLAAVARLPVAGVRPFRATSRPALAWAARVGGHWRFTYLLAVLEAANGDGASAARLLEACGTEPDEAAFYRYRAKFRSGAAQREDLFAARRCGDSWRVGYALGESYAREGDWTNACATAESYLKANPGSNPLELQYARALNRLGRYRESVAFLKTVRILPSEMGNNGSDLWIEANRALGDEAAANAYPENLGKGKPFAVDKDGDEVE